MYSGADNTGIQTAGVFVDAHRGPAPTRICVEPKTVGASLLAMDVNDNAGCLNDCVVRAFFASGLAPTDLHKSL